MEYKSSINKQLDLIQRRLLDKGFFKVKKKSGLNSAIDPCIAFNRLFELNGFDHGV